MEPYGGHVRQCSEQAVDRTAVRLYRRMGHRPVRAEEADDRRHPDGERRPYWTRTDVVSVDVLSVLCIQCPGVCLRWAAAKPGLAVAMVRQIKRKGNGS